VVLAQFVVGLSVAALTWFFTGRVSAAWSAAYGALAVVIPAALFARGLTSKATTLNSGTAVFGFFVVGNGEDWPHDCHALCGNLVSQRFELACHVGGPCGHDEGLLGGVCLAQSVSPTNLN
jgi:hypothetical protein